MVKFTDIVAFTYANTYVSDHLLQGFLLGLARHRIKKLLECSRFQELLGNGGDFSVDIVRLLSKDVKIPASDVDSESDHSQFPPGGVEG